MPRDGTRQRKNILTYYQPSQMVDWRDKLADMLIMAGTTGLYQSVIVKRLDGHVGAALLLEHLEALRAENKVQRFGKIPTIWRATTLLCESHN